MSRLIAVRLKEQQITRVDRERARTRTTRSAAIQEALDLWLAQRRYRQAVLADHAAYDKQPVTSEEFAVVLRGQAWPK